jgi:hypothetical protein
MIILLPNRTQQRDLYLAYQSVIKEKQNWSETAASAATSNKTQQIGSSFAVIDNLDRCQICYQYFKSDELPLHISLYHVALIEPITVPTAAKVTPKLNPFSSILSTNDDYPSLATNFTTENKNWSTKSNSNQKQQQQQHQQNRKKITAEEDFPSLSGGLSDLSGERFSSMPTASIFSNPKSHLSLVKKKHRLQK